MTEIVFNSFPKQDEFINAVFEFVEGSRSHINRYQFILYGGAIRGGKSYAGLGALILLSKLFPGSRWIVVRDSVETLKRNTIPIFEKLFPQSELIQKPSQSNNWTAIIPNGRNSPSQIVFFGENYARDKELNRWRGLEANGFLLEEFNELQEESFYKAFERKGTWNMNRTWELNGKEVYPSIILATCNPANNWVKELVYNRWIGGTLPESWLYIPAKVTDNPYVSDEFIQDKRDVLPDILFQKFIEGDWEVIENDMPFMYEFDYQKHVFQPTPDRPELPISGQSYLYLSFDQNVEPPACIIGQQGAGWAHIVDEIYIGEGSAYDIADAIRFQYPNFDYKITGDPSGHKREIASRNLDSFYQIVSRELGVDYHYDVISPKHHMTHKNSRDLCRIV